MCRDLEAHLGMVFHRFLSGEMRGRRLNILINGNKVQPWDPFCRGERETTAKDSFIFDVEEENISGEVLFEPFVLPREDEFSSADAWRAAGGPAKWNQQQGFYIYRAGRMIQSGGWSNLRAPDEHIKLARIAVSFSPVLDEAFKINVAKMRVQLPSQIRDELRKEIAQVIKSARQRYDRKLPSSREQVTRRSNTGPETATERLTLQQWKKETLDAAVSERERKVIRKVIGRIRAASDSGGKDN